MSKRNIYTYGITINLSHRIFENYYLKTELKASTIELDSESFTVYKECVDDCSRVLLTFKNYLEANTHFKIQQAWEPNPLRNKDDVTHSNLTKIEDWRLPEIIHIFLFAFDDDMNSTKTTPIAICTVLVEDYNLDFIPFVN